MVDEKESEKPKVEVINPGKEQQKSMADMFKVDLCGPIKDQLDKRIDICGPNIEITPCSPLAEPKWCLPTFMENCIPTLCVPHCDPWPHKPCNPLRFETMFKCGPYCEPWENCKPWNCNPETVFRCKPYCNPWICLPEPSGGEPWEDCTPWSGKPETVLRCKPYCEPWECRPIRLPICQPQFCYPTCFPLGPDPCGPCNPSIISSGPWEEITRSIKLLKDEIKELKKKIGNI